MSYLTAENARALVSGAKSTPSHKVQYILEAIEKLASKGHNSYSYYRLPHLNKDDIGFLESLGYVCEYSTKYGQATCVISW